MIINNMIEALFISTPLFVTIIFIVISIISLRISKRREYFERRTQYDENRPRVTLAGITLTPCKSEFFSGENVDWIDEKNPPKEEHKDFLKKEKERTLSNVQYDGKTFMFVNLFGRHPASNSQGAVLALNVANIIFKFEN